jgi:predicted N-acetyltransferase YhbS
MDPETPLRSPIPIARDHETAAFDCGEAALDRYLHKHAHQNHQNRSARTYVALRGQRVVGYYSLTVGSVSRDETPTRIAKGLAGYPVPVIILARLAVDRAEQGNGIGKGLLKDALLRCGQAADIVGCRAVVVHAKSEKVGAFYRKFGFEPSPTDALHLYLLVKDIKTNLDEE